MMAVTKNTIALGRPLNPGPRPTAQTGAEQAACGLREAGLSAALELRGEWSIRNFEMLTTAALSRFLTDTTAPALAFDTGSRIAGFPLSPRQGYRAPPDVNESVRVQVHADTPITKEIEICAP